MGPFEKRAQRPTYTNIAGAGRSKVRAIETSVSRVGAAFPADTRNCSRYPLHNHAGHYKYRWCPVKRIDLVVPAFLPLPYSRLPYTGAASHRPTRPVRACSPASLPTRGSVLCDPAASHAGLESVSSQAGVAHGSRPAHVLALWCCLRPCARASSCDPFLFQHAPFGPLTPSSTAEPTHPTPSPRRSSAAS